MKFKKSVSALAALTLSVTAFAGLAVTANAEELSLNYIGSAASEETFDSYTVSNGSWDTEFTTIGSADGIGIQDLSSSTSTVYTSGNVLTSRRRGGGTSYFKYTVDHAVKAGKVYFSTSIDIGNGLDGSSLSISDLYENSVLTLTIPNNTGRLSIATNSGSSFNSSGTFNPRRTYAGLKIDAIFDLDNNSVSGTLTYQNAADSNNEVSDSFKLTLNDNTSISQLVTSVNSRSKNNEDMVLDNTKFYAVVDSDTDWEAKKTTAAGAVTLNFIDSSNNSIGNSEIDVTNKYAEDKLTYYYPAYISYDGKLYKSTADTYAGDVVLTADAQTLPITYEEVSGTVQYKEFTDDKTAYDSATVQYTSNGKVYGVGGGKTEALTVAADGIYKITAPSVRVDNDSYRNGTVLVNDVSVGTVSFDNSTTNDVVENIELKAGDTIAIQGSNSKSGVDYIFIEKTGDITPEAPTATATKIATITKNADQPQAAAYTAAFTGNGSSYNKIIWTINPTEGTKTSAGDAAAAQTKEVELPSTISGESDFVIGLVVNIADADTIDSITGELGN